MKISKRTDFGLRLLFEFTQNPNGNYISARDLAVSQCLSYTFTEEILQMLKEGNLLESRRGRMGGYRLARSHATISLKEVIEVLDESTILVNCLSEANACPILKRCPTVAVWADVSRKFDDILSNISLQEAFHQFTIKSTINNDNQKGLIEELVNLLPETNCQECGFNTCLDFSIALTQKRASSEDCTLIAKTTSIALNKILDTNSD